jgi:hypothetical protein
MVLFRLTFVAVRCATVSRRKIRVSIPAASDVPK